MNRCMVLMSICLVSGQLMSMQKSYINTADELKTLALAVEPEAYVKTLEKYTVKPSAVSQSLNTLLNSHHLSDGMSTHVETTCAYNDDAYAKQIVQIMQEYRIRNTGQISFSDQIKAQIYAEVNQKISEENSEISTLAQREHMYVAVGLTGAFFAVSFGIVDLVYLIASMVHNG